MRWILASFLALILLSSVFAAGQQGGGSGQQGSGAGQATGQNQTTTQNTNEYGQGAGQGNQTQTEQRTRTTEQVRSMVRQRQQEMNQEIQNMSGGKQKTYQNQNQVRLAVHALLAMENLTGGIGRNISAMAKEFNNSVQATIRAEQRIQTRNALERFFMGGDGEAAQEIEQEVNQNHARILRLRQNMNSCNCTDEVKAMLQEQIQGMEQEQTRLQQLAQNEKQNMGLLGWLWKK